MLNFLKKNLLQIHEKFGTSNLQINVCQRAMLASLTPLIHFLSETWYLGVSYFYDFAMMLMKRHLFSKFGMINRAV